MGLVRKIKRKKNRQTIAQTICCGEKMWKKPCYDTDTEEFYFCTVCGKEKYVRKAEQSDA